MCSRQRYKDDSCEMEYGDSTPGNEGDKTGKNNLAYVSSKISTICCNDDRGIKIAGYPNECVADH